MSPSDDLVPDLEIALGFHSEKKRTVSPPVDGRPLALTGNGQSQRYEAFVRIPNPSARSLHIKGEERSPSFRRGTLAPGRLMTIAQRTRPIIKQAVRSRLNTSLQETLLPILDHDVSFEDPSSSSRRGMDPF